MKFEFDMIFTSQNTILFFYSFQPFNNTITVELQFLIWHVVTPILTTESWKTENQQLVLGPLENWGHRANQHPQNWWDTQTENHIFPGAETLLESALGGILEGWLANYLLITSYWILGLAWLERLRIPGGLALSGPPHFPEFYLQ